MTVTGVALFLAGLVVVVFIFINFLDFLERRAKNIWEVVAEGIYIESISKLTDAKTAIKMTGGYAGLGPLVWSTLVFKDGTRIKVINVEKLPAPGTYIKVLKNDRANFKIEIPPIPPSSCL